MKVVDYLILEGNNAENLRQIVIEHVGLGYTPIGGVTCVQTRYDADRDGYDGSPTANGTFTWGYAQAMVRESDHG